MNVGYEEEELKPYIEPQPDYKDPRRTGRRRNTQNQYMYLLILTQRSISGFFFYSQS